MITTIRFTISVRDRIHLARVMRRLRVLASVVRLTRRRA
jgi:GTP pyrophosphokinase